MKKINKNIKLNNKKIGGIIFLFNDSSVKNFEKQIIKNITNLESFYKTKIPKFNIELIYSRKEFNQKTAKTKTPDWLVAMAQNKKIYIFSSMTIEEHSSHKKSEIKKILTHELIHVFNNKINKNVLTWADEGLALYLANQKKKKDFTKDELNFFINNFLCKNISLRSFSKYHGYKISYWLINEIINKFGKNKLLDLIKIKTKENDCKKELEKLCIQIENLKSI